MNIFVVKSKNLFKIFLCGPRDGKVLLRSLYLARAAKKNVPWKWGVGDVWSSWPQADLFFLRRGGGGGLREEGCVASLSSI